MQNDTVYVLTCKGGEVVEQGYRVDLEVPSQAGEIESEFRRMMSAQGDGFPVRDDDEIEELGRYDLPGIEVDEVLEDINDKMKEDAGVDFKRLTTFGVPPKMFQAVQDYTRSRTNTL